MEARDMINLHQLLTDRIDTLLKHTVWLLCTWHPNDDADGGLAAHARMVVKDLVELVVDLNDDTAVALAAAIDLVRERDLQLGRLRELNDALRDELRAERAARRASEAA